MLKSKRIFIGLLLSFIFALCCGLVLAACSSKPNDSTNSNCEHQMSEWTIVEEATCTKEGKKQRTCEICGDVEIEKIPMANHSFNTSNICTKCGFELAFTTGLDYEEVKPDSYSYDGYTSYYIVSGIGNTNDKNIVIPASHAGKNVRGIKSSAFYGNDFIESVYLPEGIKFVSENAFNYCVNLKSVNFANSIESIYSNAFANCSKLSSITMPDSLTFLSGNAFNNTAFYNNTRNWTNGILYVGNFLVSAKSSSQSNVVIAENTVYICDSAFNNCVSLVSIEFPDTLRKIGDEAFKNCTKLEKIAFPNAIRSIGTRAFSYCTSLKEIDLSNINISSNSLTNDIFSNCPIEKAKISSALLSLLPQNSIKDLTITSSVSKDSLKGFGRLEKLSLTGFSGQFGSLFGTNSFANSKQVAQSYYNGSTWTDNNYYIPQSLRDVEITGSVPMFAFSDLSLENLKINNAKGTIDHTCLYQGSFNNIYVDDTFKGWVCKYAIWGEDIYDVQNFYYSGDLTSWLQVQHDWDGAFFMLIVDNVYLSEIKLEGKITVPEGTKTIPSYSFYGRSGITEIIIPESVQIIESSAFYGCPNIKYNTKNGFNYLGNSENPYLVLCSATDKTITTFEPLPETKIILYSALSGCSELKSVRLPNTIISIGSSAFSNCYQLKDLYYDVEECPYAYHIFGSAGKNSGGFTMTIGTHTKKLPDAMFAGNNGPNDYAYLKSIVIEENSQLESFGGSSFSYCVSVESVYVSKIEEWLNINFGVSASNNLAVSSYSYYSNPFVYASKFYINNQLASSIVIPEGTETIGTNCFYGMSSLISITIPSSLTNIRSNAFAECGSLYEIYNLSSLELKLGSTSYGNIAENAKIIHSASDIPTRIIVVDDYIFFEDTDSCYLISYNGNSKNLTLPGKVNGKSYSINSEIFMNNTYIESVVFSDAVTGVGESAFSGCTSLVSIDLCKATSFSGNSFYKCSSLTEITIPLGTTIIPYSCFEGCSKLTTVNLPEGIVSIGSDAFMSCYALKNITLPDSLISIGGSRYSSGGDSGRFSCSRAFNGCSCFEYENGIYYIGKWAIYITNWYNQCPENVVIRDGTVGIASQAFYNAPIKSISLPNSIKYIGGSAFSGTANHTDNIRYNYYDNAYYLGNSNNPYLVLVKAKSKDITTCRIHQNTVIICDFAFNGCSKISEITLPSKLVSIGSAAFQGCSLLTSITLPSTVECISSSAFNSCRNLANVYYCESKTNWDLLIRNNGNFTSAEVHYYSECVHNKDEWHYDAYGNISTEITIGEGEWIIDQEATCTEDGSKHGVCSVCGKIVTTQIPAHGHNEGDWITDTEPTCTETGGKHTTCTVCGVTLNTEEINANGHSVNSNGYCSVCNEHINHNIDSNGHCTICNAYVGYFITNDSTYSFNETDGVISSTNKGVNSSSASYVLTALTDITITFEYKVSSENNYDYLYILLNDTQVIKISGTSNTYKSYTVTLKAGDKLTFKYTKDSSGNSGDDCCYIRNVVSSVQTESKDS